jgi:serine/threonine-protein kinase
VVSREFRELQEVVAGRYTLERELGRGGMGIVFLARDVALDRPVAIKLLPPYLAAQPEIRDRFIQEARLVARLSHPNIVSVYAAEEQGDLCWFAMAFVRGETLTERVERAGPLPPAQAIRMFQELAWGLGYAHANGVVHRDVKPDNILIEQASGRAMLADFGVAFAADASRQTGAGQLIGTPHYISPEQANGIPLDGRSDLYSLGASMFFALTGRNLFDGSSPIAVITRHLNEPAPPLASVRQDLPRALTEAVDRCLAKDPERRFPSGEVLAEALATTGLAEYEIPPPLRHYFRQGRGVALAWLMAFALGLWFWRWLDIPDDPVSRIAALLLLVLALGWPLLYLIRTARRSLLNGLTFHDVKDAAKREARVLAEESKAVYGREFSGELSRTREDWLRFLAGPFGRVIFGIAGIGLEAPPPAPHPDSRPAERMLNAEAVSLFQGLPPELQDRFKDLPDLEEELCCRAEEIRDETGPGQAEELSRVIGALERVRLDLLRLRAGEGSPEEVRRALSAAAQVYQETGTRRVPS